MSPAIEPMSVWGLIEEASPLVKLVMLTLVLASLASWYLIVRRSLLLGASERLCRDFLRRFRGSAELAPLYREAAELPADAGLERLFRAGYGEFQQLGGEPGVAPEAVIEGVERSLLVAISEEEERLGKGLALLASIGSVSPYIGLFGTVWGIMNSFIGLSQVRQATLSTVAPGIAEALIATAIGLFAAIPAVLAYNRFSARVASLSSRYYAFGNELQGRLHRRLQAAPGLVRAA
ncbi:TolQ-like protein [Azotobacter vinelandii CA]|uniref:Tol-Pal system protein TolQ n=2 Tax=Azotobacter vinelandii TaxID=354 RepID=C1DJG7_AZOVD|nr:protein TolQ [Azotobacter vinelandii]ACO76752.1 TolQ-like protein [Azotobacter vinelandii DJ]AGK15588.1 TolQ-like protein [Azotobacter vinelandii CA]AGK19342.1 TolQ-like protein [Azotobacter vinelandii CA6]WKN22515.1 protein TolQ [Azotobacter vinelandii]SFX81391.1 Cell division and transport-associated protein TolQ [Azotobacter vinelandii]